MNSAVKNVFILVAGVLLASLLYVLFFVGDNSAIMTACRAVERPVAIFYSEYALHPSIYCNELVDNSLGITHNVTSGDIKAEEVDDSTTVADYSTGWR